MRRFVLPVALAAALLVGPGCGGQPRVNGGGASFVYPLMLQWTRVYERKHGVQIDYQSTGSGNGVQQTLARTIQFGSTDAFIKPDLLKEKGIPDDDVVHVPLVMGAVVPIYNVPEAKDRLRFTGPLLSAMYRGIVRYWDDPALVELNPDADLPHREVVVVSRADGSGTTAIFTDYLGKVSPEWKKDVGSGTSVTWPRAAQNVGQRGNEGVAGHVGRSTYSLGYVELIYAIQNEVSYGSVETRDSAEKKAKDPSLPLTERKFLVASLDVVSAAADSQVKSIPDDMRFSLTNCGGPNSYPITGTNWAVLYRRQPAGTGPALVAFLRWATEYGGEGQEYARLLGYAPLPKALAERIRHRLDLVTFE